MSEMVARLAAIVRGPGAMCRVTHAEAEDIAQDVLAAMREPTEGMIAAGCLALSKVPPETFMALQLAGSNQIIARDKMRRRYKAIIDAALNEEQS